MLCEEKCSDKLTNKEKDILKLITKGLSNKQISEKLAITEGTVKQQINSILSKMKMKNRHEIIYKFWDGEI